MKGRLVALGSLAGREAAALLVDGRLADLLVASDDPLLPGAILRGTVDRPVKGQGGVFIRLPGGATGFLRDGAGLRPGAPVLVQVAGTAEPGKAPPLTARLLFKGRHVILTPGAPGLNLSRRIRDGDTRARLDGLAARAMAGSPHGLILRSAAALAPGEETEAEIAALRELADRILADLAGPPELLLDAPGPHEEAWRDWADPEPDELDADPHSFDRHGIAAMVDALLAPAVPLPGGGHMAIEPTRALIAVDVNTGADTSAAAGLKANIAAARDLPRQLRLRGLGGQVVVDFAPMPKKDRAAVEQQLRAAFKGEAAETSLAGWTPLGNYELQRKRDRQRLALILGGG